MTKTIASALLLLIPAVAWAETYTYDERGRITGALYDDGSEIHFTWDSNGNLTRREIVASTSMPDVGGEDTSASGADTTATSADTATAGADTSTAPRDTTSTTPDVGSGDLDGTDKKSGGCGCSTRESSGSPRGSSLLVFALFAVLLGRSRRSRGGD